MYKNMNDYEILYMVRENNDDFTLLYEKYQPLIYKIMLDYQNTFKKYGYELDDLLQIGYITLFKAAHLYNIYNDAVFFSYLKKALVNSVIAELRKNSTSKKEMLNHAFSYDATVPNTNYTYLDILPVKQEENIDDVICVFKNTLEFSLSCVFELVYNGYRIREIAHLMDEKENDIKKCIQEIKKQALTYKYLFLN